MKRYEVVQYPLLFSIMCLFITNAHSVELSNALVKPDTSNCHATYFPKDGKLLVPCVEVVSAVGDVQSYEAVLEQLITAEDSLQFVLKEWLVSNSAATTEEEASCRATYFSEEGRLLMPCVDVVDSSGKVESHEVVMGQLDSTLVELPKWVVTEVDEVEIGKFRTRSANGSVRGSTTLPAIPTVFGNVLTSSIWSSPTISVCWENPTSTNAYYRDIVKNAVEGTWDKVSGVDFVGWDKCLTNSKGIRIVWKDEPGDSANYWPHTKGLGKQLDGKPNGMLLNHEFNNWVEGRGCRNTKDYCVRVIGVHEFGHALGFAHEQARRDTATWCTDKQQGGETGGDVYIGAWDLDSVMNYCNPTWSGNGNLSQTDILTVQTYYGQPPGSTLPSKPTNLSAVALSSSSIKIIWSDNSNNETGFYIYRWNGADWTRLGSVGANVTSYTNSGLQAGTTYYYYVASYNGASENPSENYAYATTQQVSRPNKPASISATALSSSSIKLTWSDSSNNETGFYIYRSPGGEWSKISSVGANVTSYTDKGLQANTTYSYYVASYNTAGEYPSDSTSAKTQPTSIAGGTTLSITISGQYHEITIRETSGTGDSGSYTISGQFQNKTFYLPAGKKATVSLSGQRNKLYISSSIFGNVTYSSSGQLNEVVKIQ
ncbi:MAG: hypothetical protein BWK78_04070 [Thiotrichaceae bacterium IS1]|nr:MAG: hypothetical protein BWK78_04070 [Thiotrichaceae bacterium IS1]